MATEQNPQSDEEYNESKNLQSVSIEDLCQPFTTEEFVKQKYPNKLQSVIIRHVATRMVVKKETFIHALKGFAKERKSDFPRVVRVLSWLYNIKLFSWVAFLLLIFVIFFYTPELVAHNLDYIMERKIVMQIQSCWSDNFDGTLIDKFATPVLPAVYGFAKLLIQILTLCVLFIPSFRDLIFSAIRIEETPSELQAQYAEKNLDVLLSPMRPAGMQTIILENFPNYPDQQRSAAQGIEFQAYITRATDIQASFPNNLEHIFSNEKHFEKVKKHLPGELEHYQWCLIGMWAFGEVKPNEGSDWGEKLDYIQFAKSTFAQCIYSYASESGITPARLESFKEDFPDIDCLHDNDKREQFISDTISDENTDVLRVLQNLLPPQKKSDQQGG